MARKQIQYDPPDMVGIQFFIDRSEFEALHILKERSDPDCRLSLNQFIHGLLSDVLQERMDGTELS